MQTWKALRNIVGATLAAGLASAIALTPIAAVGAVVVDRTNATMQSNLEDITQGQAPGVTTILDANDEPIAWIYAQRRFEVPSDQIAQPMKDAIVAIEDRRFYEHNGVDIQGNLRAMASNIFAGGIAQGASTIDQQYVKNYLLFVTSKTEDEQAAAIETSIPRKLREMRMASEIDATLSKDEILTRYLNLIPYGNGAFGIEAAARTYFGISAAELSVPQAAMLAGIVQSTSALNPYTNPDATLQRRNTVLAAMADVGSIQPADLEALQLEPLGVLEEPQGMPNGCIVAGSAGFFCDYVLQYLDEKGISQDTLTSGAYTIRTTLEPAVQEAAVNALQTYVSPQTQGVAEVMNIIEPGEDSRAIRAMASSRNYGLDLENGETMLPQPSSLVGNGAGSVFKIFTAAAALEAGYGLDTMIDVPRRYEARGMGEGGADNCPAGSYCVENSGSYASSMSLRDNLAQSPNTSFVKLLEEVGVERVVDISVALGLRSYTDAGSFDGQASVADYVKEHNLGSYTLGPTAVNALELSNVAATLASEGRWCEPSPIREVTDADGNQVYLETPACEQAIDAEIARALANGMGQDATRGTAADAASAAGWQAQVAAKTGTTESNQSAAFLGFNSNFAAATYIYNDGTTISPLCTSPVVQCSSGTLFGGGEPARTWFMAAGNTAGAASGTLPSMNESFAQGASAQLARDLEGRTEEDARRQLTAAGYRVSTQYQTGDGSTRGTVMRAAVPTPLQEGATITLYLSDGTSPRPTLTVQPDEPEFTQDELDNLTQQLQELFGF
ncbi:transglycosylase domain-containing protein [Corynebacterium kozikiae]|uniref:transglycosylase domain-containing protein n=1 Tax=Corynebacterium kozikiae TaxID=2968469 RepID=UPI00211CD278|nr:transglycosylase domain-containing protein [Corynebacterium sp. 76QC2CO]